MARELEVRLRKQTYPCVRLMGALAIRVLAHLGFPFKCQNGIRLEKRSNGSTSVDRFGLCSGIGRTSSEMCGFGFGSGRCYFCFAGSLVSRFADTAAPRAPQLVPLICMS